MFGGWAGEELRVALTLYTDAYVVRGTLGTRQRRLSDIVNHAEDDFLVLSDATFAEFGSREPAHQASFAQVNLGAVLFAVADREVEPVPELRTPKVSEAALVSIPPFKIAGRIHLLPERDLRQALQELLGRFLPVTDVRFWSDAAGVPPTEAQMVAVNHARAQILSPYGEWSATGGTRTLSDATPSSAPPGGPAAPEPSGEPGGDVIEGAGFRPFAPDGTEG